MYGKKSLEHHKRRGVLKIVPNVQLKSREDLSVFYTPGIAEVSKLIANDKSQLSKYTMKRNTVAIISDGSAVLGLGNIGPEAALPVMEGKALLFSKFAGIDAFPIILGTQDSKEIIRTIKNIALSFGGINLEDISAPRCFEIENALQELGIPVMHDDQHGTAVVVLAGLINALKVVKKKTDGLRVVFSGAGAAGTAVAKMILYYSENKANITMVDRNGAICPKRDDLNSEKKKLLKLTKNKLCGTFSEVIKGADVIIGVSAPNILTKEMVRSMAENPIIFALANPVPEIDPVVAKEAGAAVVATGRSDFPNQINNVLAFPGIFRGALNAEATKITMGMKIVAAEALAGFVTKPSAKSIIPSALNDAVVCRVSKAVAREAVKEKVAQAGEGIERCPLLVNGQFRVCKTEGCPYK